MDPEQKEQLRGLGEQTLLPVEEYCALTGEICRRGKKEEKDEQKKLETVQGAVRELTGALAESTGTKEIKRAADGGADAACGAGTERHCFLRRQNKRQRKTERSRSRSC